MTNYAQFSNVFSDGSAFYQSADNNNSSLNDRLIVGSDGFSAQYNYYDYTSDSLTSFVCSPITEKVVFWFNVTGTSGLGCGIFNGSEPVLNPGQSLGSTYGAFFTNQLGNVIFNGSVLYTIGDTSSFGFYVDGTNGKAWLTIDNGVTFYGATSTALTAADVEAGTGGVDLAGAGFTGPYLPFFSNTAGTAFLNSGQSAYPGTVPSGFGNLTPTLTASLQPATSGGTVSVVWSNGTALSGTLQYSTDVGTTWTNCGGAATGTGGTATCGTAETIAAGTADLSVIYCFRDSGNVYNCPPFAYLPVITPPAGAGPCIASYPFHFRGGAQPSTRVPLISGAYSKVYFAVILLAGNTNDITFSLRDPSDTEVWSGAFVQPGDNAVFDYGDLNGNPPASGSGASVTSTVGKNFASGTLDATSRAVGTISLISGDPPTYSPTIFGPDAWPGTSATPFDHFVLTDTTSRWKGWGRCCR